MTTTIKASALRDKAQALAESIRPLLHKGNDWQVELSGSTIWLKDIHDSGYVAWCNDNLTMATQFTQAVLPEARQICSGIDRLPTEAELTAFIEACQTFSFFIGDYAAEFRGDGKVNITDHYAVIEPARSPDNSDDWWEFGEDGQALFAGTFANCCHYIQDEWEPIASC
jgi:hypothetical protein